MNHSVMADSKFNLPHSHEDWPRVKRVLKEIADKVTVGSLDAIGEVVLASPYWGLDTPPQMNILNKALSKGDHFTKEAFFGEILPYIATRAMAVETLFPETSIKVMNKIVYP